MVVQNLSKLITTIVAFVLTFGATVLFFLNVIIKNISHLDRVYVIRVMKVGS